MDRARTPELERELVCPGDDDTDRHEEYRHACREEISERSTALVDVTVADAEAIPRAGSNFSVFRSMP